MPTALGLAHHAATQPRTPALIIDDAVRTYAELNGRVNRLARALRAAGVHAGDRVAAALHNQFEWYELLNAAGKIGAMLVPVGYRLKGPEIAYMTADSGAQIIVASPDLHGEIDRAVTELAWPSERLWVTGPLPPWRGEAYESRLARESAAEPEAAFTGGGYNVMAYTSGTTGQPKGVERAFDPATAHQTLAGIAQLWNLKADDVHLVAGPLYHTGPAGYAQVHLLIGATVVTLPRFEAEMALAAVQRHRVSTTFMVPTHFNRILLLDTAARRQYDLSSLRLVLHSAAPCPEHVKRGIMNVFPPNVVTEFYGASESGFTRITAEEWLRKPGSVGRPWPGHDIKIIAEDGRDCAPGEIGLIYVKGPMLQFRYRGADEKTRGAFRDGYFTAGDLGYVDADGYLFIADRRTDLILSGGANIYPAEVESVLLQHPGVADAAVVGIPDDDLGQIVLAVVEPRARQAVSPDALITFCRNQLAHYKCPRRVVIVDQLPREPQGKVRKRELAERYRTQ